MKMKHSEHLCAPECGIPQQCGMNAAGGGEPKRSGGMLVGMLLFLIVLGFFSLYVNMCRPVWWDQVLISAGLKKPLDADEAVESPAPTLAEAQRDNEIARQLEHMPGVFLMRETGTQLANALEISDVACTEELASLVGELKFLRSFTLQRATFTAPEFLVMMRNKEWLQNFIVSDSEISPEMAEALPGLLRVQTFSLTDAALDEKCLAYVRKMPEVRILDLSGSPLTAKGLGLLADMKTVTHVVMQNCDLDDSCLEMLGKMPKVKRLTVLKGNQITSETLKNFRAAFPQRNVD